MTTTVDPALLASRDDLRSGQRVSLTRLMRVALIQHRAALITIFVTFIVLVIALVVGRDAVDASYASYLAAGCTLAHPIDPQVCADTANRFADIPSFTPLVFALRLFPLVVGAFVGAPMVGRELELGTYRFAWTQGVGRTRLLLVTLAMLALIVTPTAAALGFLLGGWYLHPYAVINSAVGSHWQWGLFTTTWWLTPVWTLFALSLGTFVGAVVKRTVAAIATTALVIGGVLLTAGLYVNRIFAVGAVASSRILLNGMNSGPLNFQATQGQAPVLSWLVRAWYTGPNGHVLATKAANKIGEHVNSLLESANGTNDPGAAKRWLALHHFQYWVSYQPANHFWILQAIVGLAVLVAAALCVLGSVRSIRHNRS